MTGRWTVLIGTDQILIQTQTFRYLCYNQWSQLVLWIYNRTGSWQPEKKLSSIPRQISKFNTLMFIFKLVSVDAFTTFSDTAFHCSATRCMKPIVFRTIAISERLATSDPIRGKLSKLYSSLKALLNFSQTSPDFFSMILIKIVFGGFLKFESPFFKDFFRNLLSQKGAMVEGNRSWASMRVRWQCILTVECILTVKLSKFEVIRCISNFWQPCTCISKSAGRRVEGSEIWASGLSIQCMQDTFDVWQLNV